METPTKVLFTGTPAMSMCNSSPADSDAPSTISSSLLSRNHHSASSQRHGSISKPMIHLSNVDTQVANSPGTTAALQAQWSTISAAMKGHSQSAAELLMKQAANTAQLEEMVKALFSQLRSRDDEKAALQAQLKRDRAEFTAQAKALSQHFTASQHKSTALQVIHEALQAELKSAKESLSDSMHVNNTLRQQLEEAKQEAQEQRTALSSVQSELHATHSVLKDVQQQNEENMCTNKELRASNTALKTQLASLVAAERELTEQLRTTHKQIDEQLGQLRQQLKNERQRRLLVTRRKSELAAQVSHLTEQVAALSAQQPGSKGHGQGSIADTHMGRDQVLPPMRKVLQSRSVLVRSSISAAGSLKRPVRLATQRSNATRTAGTPAGVTGLQSQHNASSSNTTPLNASTTVRNRYENNVHEARNLQSPSGHSASPASSLIDPQLSSADRPSWAGSTSEPGQLRQQRRAPSQAGTSASATPVSRNAMPAAVPRSTSQHSLRGGRPLASNGNTPVPRLSGSNSSTPHVSGGAQRPTMHHPSGMPTTPITTPIASLGDALHLLTPTSQHGNTQPSAMYDINLMQNLAQAPQSHGVQNNTPGHVHRSTSKATPSHPSPAPSYVVGPHAGIQPLNLDNRLEVLPLSREISEETVGVAVQQAPSLQGFRVDRIQIVHGDSTVSKTLGTAPVPASTSRGALTPASVNTTADDDGSKHADDRMTTSTLQSVPAYHPQQSLQPQSGQVQQYQREEETESFNDNAAALRSVSAGPPTNNQQQGLLNGAVPLASLQQVQQLLQGLRLLQQQVGPPMPANPNQHPQQDDSHQRTQPHGHGVEQIPASLMQSFAKAGDDALGADRASTDQQAHKQQAEQQAVWLHQIHHDRINGRHDGVDQPPVLKSVALLQAYHAQQQQSHSQ